ncbi:hypothetical protein BAWI5_20600 [Bacillus wiedmannii]
MKYYSIGEFADLIGKTTQTLRNWDKQNVFKPHHVTDSGYRYYSQEQLNHFLGIKGEMQLNKIVIGYCRSFAWYLLVRCTKPTSLARSRKVFGDKKL